MVLFLPARDSRCRRGRRQSDFGRCIESVSLLPRLPTNLSSKLQYVHSSKRVPRESANDSIPKLLRRFCEDDGSRENGRQRRSSRKFKFSSRGRERWGGGTRSDSKNRIPIDGPNAFFSQLNSTHPLIQFFSTSTILQHKRRSGVNDEQIAFMSSSINYESRVIA